MELAEIVIEVAREQAEALSDALMEADALSVSIEDADVGTDAEKPLFGEPGMEPAGTAWNRSKVVVLVSADSDMAALVAHAARQAGLPHAPDFAVRNVADQDWVRLTQSQFDPIRIGNAIWVVPSWHDAPDPDAVVLELDPGLAFGTGSHPTTRLCMEWLERHLPTGASVLDYGCGSGILGILAAKLGSTAVVGVDIDPQALESARHNAERNHCVLDLHSAESFTRVAPGAVYDVVVANILAGPLQSLVPVLTGRIAAGGWLVLSGILAEQADDVISAYVPHVQLAVVGSLEGWVALAGQCADTAGNGIPGHARRPD